MNDIKKPRKKKEYHFYIHVKVEAHNKEEARNFLDDMITIRKTS